LYIDFQSGQSDADKIIGASKWIEAKDEWQLPKMHFDVQLPKLALPGATSNNNASNSNVTNPNAYEEKRRSNKYDSESSYTARAQALSTLLEFFTISFLHHLILCCGQ
jgi:hypothetical protein